MAETPACGAKLCKSDPPRYCKRRPLKGKKRCALHGGKSLSGINHPNWQGRGYSKDLPTRYADRMQSFEDDADLIRLGSELRLLDARMGEIMTKFPTGESGLAWDLAKTAMLNIGHANRAGDSEKLSYWLEKLDEAVAKGDAERSGWVELYHALELRRKLADTERKRIELHESTMTAKEAQTFFAALQVAILEEVPDRETRLRLAKRLELLLITNTGAR